ncbi:periplasmic heavy metal sensor [Ruegeria lacuscaerulensis]|uniref:periplasmic heavy metal sensor n=1 Tax=Ruegeria lacuscaerulensis TaxID=55218 RepID=UPI001BE41A49|nr:periplasmic heavy metal sensor [Ruegeria lacuscaerulensis]
MEEGFWVSQKGDFMIKFMPKFLIVTALCTIQYSQEALAQSHTHDAEVTPYAGLQSRTIKSLSETDLEELRRGGGWGFALPAELNGKPGPAHLLELQDELGLSKDQVERIEAIYSEMRKQAIVAGERFIEAEAALSEAFAGDQLDLAELNKLVKAAETARAELRLIHLSRHLQTTPLLSADQIQQYNILRGYANDPCFSVPEGHDPTMWKKHNGCS